MTPATTDLKRKTEEGSRTATVVSLSAEELRKLNAYWRSGYFGNEQPYRSKAFRFGKLISDQDPSAFSVTLRLVARS